MMEKKAALLRAALFKLCSVLAIKVAFRGHLLARVRRGVGIVARPSGLAISGATLANVDRRAIHDGFVLRTLSIGHARRYQSAAATDAFGVDLGIVLANAAFRQRADNAARGAASDRACSRCRKPSSRDDRTDAGNGQQAETGQQANAAAERSTDACALGSAFGSVVRAVIVTVMVFALVPALGIARHNADIVVREAGGFETSHGFLGIRVGIVQARDCGGHGFSFFKER